MTLKIGITQKLLSIKQRNEIVDSLDTRLIDWISAMDFIPVPIPNNLYDLERSERDQAILQTWLKEIKLDAVLLSGGDNFGTHKIRDKLELYILNWARKRVTPVLGICRGMQLMAMHNGGSLEEVFGHVAVIHDIKIEKKFSKIQLPKKVNSFHQYKLSSCPNEFDIIAKSVDDTIEAISHKNLPWEGWMWHPERNLKFSEFELHRAKSLFNGKT